MITREAALCDELLGLGLPIATVRRRGETVELVFPPGATPQQIAQANAVKSAKDWSPTGDAAFEEEQRRSEWKAALASTDAVGAAARSALKVIFASIVETRTAINRVIAYCQGTGSLPSPLTIRTWDEALLAVKSQIDSEINNATLQGNGAAPGADSSGSIAVP